MDTGTHLETPNGEDMDRPVGRSWSDEDERALRLWTVLARSYSTFAGAMARKIAEYDLTVPQFGVLEALHHLGSMSLGDLAEKLLVTGGNITYVMDRLEERDLVYRERSSEDRRVVHAHLTPEGRRLISEVFPDHTEYVRRLAGVLSPEEQMELRRLLKKLGKTVTAQEGIGPSGDSGGAVSSREGG